MSSKPVVFADVGTSYAAVLEQMNKIQPCTFLAYGDEMFTLLKRMGIEAHSFECLVADEIGTIAGQHGLDAVLTEKQAYPLPSVRNPQLGWPEAWHRRVEDITERITKGSIRNQVLLVEALNLAVSRFQPSLALLWEDVLLTGKTLALFFREAGVPTIHVTHTLGGLFYNGHDQVHTDRIAVQGARTRDWYLRVGVAPERVVVTGAPYWDDYCVRDIPARMAAHRRHHSIDVGRKLVLFCSTWTHSLSFHSDPLLVEKSYDLFLRAAASMENEDIEWVVKPHPSDVKGVDWYQTRASEAGLARVRVLQPKAHTEPWVIACDAVLCVDSMVGAAGILTGKPVINLPLVHYHEPLFRPDDPVVEVTNEEDLRMAIRAVLHDETLRAELDRRRPRAVYELNYLHDGRASERLAHLGFDLMKSAERKARSYSYYGHPRPELEPLIPREARTILDVGCASGAVGHYLKSQRSGLVVWGIESVKSVAEEASKVLDHVIHGNIEDPSVLAGHRFDVVLLSDVLEHLLDPWTVLESLRDRLTDEGCVVASIPNVGHWSVIGLLLDGRWPYEREGLLDRDHVRFFTLDEIGKLFSDTGWVIEEVLHKTTSEHPIVPVLKQAASSIGRDPEKAVLEMSTFQYLLRARPKVRWVASRLLHAAQVLSEGHAGEAEGLFRYVQTVDPASVQAALGLARSLCAQKRFAAAFQALHQLAARVPLLDEEVALFRLTLAECTLAVGKRAESRRIVTDLLSIQPNHDAAKNLLAQIDEKPIVQIGGVVRSVQIERDWSPAPPPGGTP